MVDRAGGQRRKTRYRLRKLARDRGKVSTTKLLQEFKQGDRVAIRIEPAVQKGMSHPHYKGLVGTVLKSQGSAYIVEVRDGNKKKVLISAPIHLDKISQ